MRELTLKIARLVWRFRRLALVLCLAGLIGLVVLTHQTSTPLFCSSCHEMKYEYRTWQASSHGHESCEVCHYHAGVIGMVRTKIQGAREAMVHFTKRPSQSEIGPGLAHVPSERCLKCHRPEALPNEITYHLLRHTHRRHLERGAQCTDCHANVVHGGKAPFKNTPTMTSCLKCHDGAKAPNRCGLCHLRLGEIRPAVYNPEWVARHRENLASTGEQNCRRCHNEDFCRSCHAIARPHSADWVRKHQNITPEERKKCAVCHEPRGSLPEADFCTQCHLARRAHRKNWLAEHPKEFQKEPDACGHCHQESFCNDCHQIFMPHERGWLQDHPKTARERRDSCRTCHKDEFCRDCHTHGRPTSHTAEWPKTHSAEARRSSDSCRVCHPTNFCQSCHTKHPPASHQAGRWVQIHGQAALGDRKSCTACHDSGYCASCHRGITMPHPPDWLRLHPANASRSEACRVCHAEQFCRACHQGAKPQSHTEGWPRTHGRVAAQSRTACLKCHGASYCELCHRLPMPHPKGIRTTHPQLARGPSGRYCGLCHAPDQCAQCHSHQRPASHRDPKWPQRHGASEGADGRCALCHRANSCDACHGLPMPHPDDWVLSAHGPAAEKNPPVCARCHQPAKCQTCHQSTPPKSHEAKDFRRKHGAKPAAETLCALCHGRDDKQKRDACATCHHGVKMPHPDGWALDHKAQGSFAKDGACLACHKPDDCKVCHSGT